MKRYSIVRADKLCPLFESNKLCDLSKSCWTCKVEKNYGDTKEQLIRKVAQVLFKIKYKTNKRFYGRISDNFKKRLYMQCLEQAKEIVEFLGVKR